MESLGIPGITARRPHRAALASWGGGGPAGPAREPSGGRRILGGDRAEERSPRNYGSPRDEGSPRTKEVLGTIGFPRISYYLIRIS